MALENKVSVLITSYNKAEYLKRSIDSVLNQETNFNYEIIIVDDGSNDGSINIIKGYSDNRIIKYLKKHEGITKNYFFGLSQCDGKYIAFCDCDDCWIDQFKLQKQVTYMENNLDCGLCITKVYTREKGKLYQISQTVDYINNNMSFDSLLKGNAYIYAQSYLLRKSDFEKYIDFNKLMKFNTWDYPIVLELIRHTRFHCLDFYSAIYEKNTESVTNTKNRLKRIKYLIGIYRIRIHFILKYGCKLLTVLYLIYRIIRDCYSVVLKRWN